MSCGCAALRVEDGELPGLGRVWVVRDACGALCELHLAGLHAAGPVAPQGAAPLGGDLRLALENYVAGDDAALLALSLSSAPTPFGCLVRQALRDIPLGQVRTYGEVARAVGKPGAARAIGRACAANPLPVLVPCHRVVASRGLGGFALGADAKRALLALEGIDIALCAGFR